MEASTQPQPAIPSKVFPDQPSAIEPSDIPTEELKKKQNLPFIISLILFFLVIAILLVLFFLTNRPGSPNNQSPVSAPVTQTTTTPETSASNTTPVVADTSTNTFEARLFYLGFDYKNALTTDKTTRVTHADGTTQCFEEIATGDGINLYMVSGDTSCTGTTSRLPDGEEFNVTSKDGKAFNFSVTTEPVNGNFTSTGIFVTSTPSNYLIKFTIVGKSLEEAKANSEAIIKTLIFDTSKLKTELTDTITQNATET